LEKDINTILPDRVILDLSLLRKDGRAVVAEIKRDLDCV
jgi:DNA-binding response OmpR family regulator